MKISRTYINIFISVFVGIIIWFSSGLFDAPLEGWHIFSVLMAIVLGFILKSFPTGFIVMLGLMVLSVTQTITVEEAMSGFMEPVAWLIVAAFLIARSVMDTGLGERIALKLTRSLGRTIISLGYSICFTELILGPVVPSNTARGGGIIAPIVNSISNSLNSTPGKEPEKAGQYLTLVGAHANLIAAAMFLTGMASNPVAAEIIGSTCGINFGWETWALGAIVPGLAGMTLLPLVVYRLSKPTLRNSRIALDVQQGKLQSKNGKMSRNEWILSAVLVMLLLLWSTKSINGLDTALVAWIGVCILLLFRVQRWSDVLSNEKAWDALVWIGGLITIARSLKTYGFIEWFVFHVKVLSEGHNGLIVLIVLAVAYFYSMYLFSSITAHLASLLATFLTLALIPFGHPLIAAALFAYFSNLCGCLTNYSTGPFIIYYGFGYVPASRWFYVGFMMSLFHIIIWVGIGMIWWKILGWW